MSDLYYREAKPDYRRTTNEHWEKDAIQVWVVPMEPGRLVDRVALDLPAIEDAVEEAYSGKVRIGVTLDRIVAALGGEQPECKCHPEVIELGHLDSCPLSTYQP